MPVDLDFDYEVAIKNMDIFSQEHIDNLHDWTQKLDKSKYVPKDLSNKQLLLFYNACEGDIERTKICIERYYNLRRSTPEMFDNRILTTEENKAALEALSLRKFFQYVQEAMPVRMRAIHVFNTEPVLDKLLLLIRPSALPSDHGGTLPDMRTLHKKCTLTLQALEPYFTAEEKQRIETLSDKKREKHMEKAFKNLDID
ncbi:unnamed protein product [Leptidea sinapis]|uniref:CRAL-TRIO domain-containing protein n=1 Tax=Leptidea sinapis TaxID=189913 RepID=A0A5E4PQI0_9NEOP|nr:unnamed protein product [Leptidea sinapis]